MKAIPASAANPLAPCSLLTAKRLRSQVNGLWVWEIHPGKVRPIVPTDPFLKDFRNDVKDGVVPGGDPIGAAEIVARLFARLLVGESTLSSTFTSHSTQEQCLEEIFSPGTIRKRLIEEKKFPPG